MSSSFSFLDKGLGSISMIKSSLASINSYTSPSVLIILLIILYFSTLLVSSLKIFFNRNFLNSSKRNFNNSFFSSIFRFRLSISITVAYIKSDMLKSASSLIIFLILPEKNLNISCNSIVPFFVSSGK